MKVWPGGKVLQFKQISIKSHIVLSEVVLCLIVRKKAEQGCEPLEMLFVISGKENLLNYLL